MGSFEMKSGKIISLLVITVLLLQACGSVSNPDTAVNRLEEQSLFSTEQTDSIASVLSKFPDGTQFSIAVVQDTSASFYGAQRDSDQLVNVDNSEQVFEIGSISKVFTSTLLAHAIMDGLVEPDRPVTDYLDFSIHENPQFTWMQLSNHTSGLPRLPGGYFFNFLMNMNNPYKNFDEEEILDFLQNRLEMNTEPGEEHLYSNLGAGVLGLFLGLIEEKSYEELLQEKVFGPLEMGSSTTIRSKIEEQLVQGRTKRGGIAKNWDLAALAGAGGILSTTSDLSRFMMKNFDTEDEVLAYQKEPTYRVSESTEMAMGWFILTRDSGQKWYWHNGGTGGYRTSMVFSPEHNVGVILLSNISAGHQHAEEIDRLSFLLMNHYASVEILEES
ncbi:penicillin-binding protein [Rhodohalobacter barkolensis]|uniref:Beta-lactamase n=2 Tax=Rhodohalobacter barkolensis TaxID=2053187 RepID=A0A2N0VIT4_9BACT|nr:penicillin-binding protein [Rhodohalobacter barkolensis]